MTSRVLGNSGERVTPVLGNSPGGLQLLPNKLYRTNGGATAWLTVTENGATRLALPSGPRPNPYADIYRVKAVVRPDPQQRPSANAYWGLVDPALLGAAPPAPASAARGTLDDIDADLSTNDVWADYLTLVDEAESFHDRLGAKAHPHTFCIGGTGHTTTDAVELRIESNWVRSDPYPVRGFRGFFTDAAGQARQAVLQDGAGDGDATVPRSSSRALDARGKAPPGDTAVHVEHQPAYENSAVQTFVIQAITALCNVRYQMQRGTAAGAAPAR
jgi:hypothetical protein